MKRNDYCIYQERGQYNHSDWQSIVNLKETESCKFLGILENIQQEDSKVQDTEAKEYQQSLSALFGQAPCPISTKYWNKPIRFTNVAWVSNVGTDLADKCV